LIREVPPESTGSLVGAGVRRVGDRRLVTGAGAYAGDLDLPGMVHAAVVRSPLPHARVGRVDASAALRMPGVLDVVTPEIAGRATEPLRCVSSLPGQRQTSHPVAPADVARYVGEPLGLVVATTREAAQDAVELALPVLEELPCVVSSERALAPGAPLLYPGWGDNLAATIDLGDPIEVVEAAMAAAAHVVSLRLHIPRQTARPMETRGLVASWDRGASRLTVWTSTQAPHQVRDTLAESLRLRCDQVRVIAPDVGGGFGGKNHLHPDEVLVCLASLRLGVPVKWIEGGRESFLASVHAREQVHDARLAVDAGGRFVALHTSILADVGAHVSNVGAAPHVVTATLMEGPYRFEAAGASLRCVFTNRTPLGAYRGFGAPEATFVTERLVDVAARRLGIPAHELRRRNLLRREDLPHGTRAGLLYDSGDYVRALDRAVQLIGPERPDDGRRRGVGLACYVMPSGQGSCRAMQAAGIDFGGYETAVLRVEPDGSVTLASGVSPHGQGLETSLAQLAADRLGVPLESVRVVTGDTESAPYSGAGTIASRSMAIGGGAVVRCAARLRERILAIAGHLLEAAVEDLEIAGGSVRVRGSGRAVPLRAIARTAWLGRDLPDGAPIGLEERDVYDPPDVTYSYGTHAAAVAVDAETGEVRLERYVVVHDCGVVVNPTIVEGQIHGGVAQGIAGALLEELVYGGDGQLRTSSYLDYLVPTAAEIPTVVVEHLEIPSPFIPGGMKGVGESGVIGPPAAIANALADALGPAADLVAEAPFSPERVWAWMRGRGLTRDRYS
jgi:aerobic carbon-monoxide dehydrogenase large subunit